MTLRRIAAVVLEIVMCLGLTACQVYRRQPITPPVSIPEGFSHSGPAAFSNEWWQAFGDPQLDALMGRAFQDNFDLRRAWARLEQARALAVQSGADVYPSLTADATASRGRAVASGFGGAASTTRNRLTLGLAANYEVDLWGRIQSLKRAGALSLEATNEDLDTAALSVTAAIGETWFALIEQRAQQELLAEQIESSRTFLELVELRFSQGQASALGVYQQRQQLATTESQAPQIQSRLEVLEHQLAVLVGVPPPSRVGEPQATLPALPPFPDTGLPADLLSRRPDVRGAQLRVAAADSRVGAAIADRLPALRLSGAYGYQSSQLSDLLRDWVWNIAGGLTAPVFEGGRRAAEVDRTKAVVSERLAEYGQTVLTAFQEVEDAVSQERGQGEFVVLLERRVELAKSTLEQARLRYANGLSDYLPVLTALQVQQREERDLITARRQLVSFRIQLYRALGGSWAVHIEPALPASPRSGDNE